MNGSHWVALLILKRRNVWLLVGQRLGDVGQGARVPYARCYFTAIA